MSGVLTTLALLNGWQPGSKLRLAASLLLAVWIAYVAVLLIVDAAARATAQRFLKFLWRMLADLVLRSIKGAMCLG